MATAYPTQELLNLAVEEWGEGLSGLVGDDIQYGLSMWKEDWPPSLPEFRKLCGERRRESHRIYKALPMPEPDPEVAREQIRLMREWL